jgi:hypothetical protein
MKIVPSPSESSPFAQAALALDEEFAQLERLSGEIERQDVETDNGLERSKLLLVRFTECSQRIGEGVQRLSSTLNDARTRAEQAASSVAARAQLIQERQNRVDAILGRFQNLSEMVAKVTGLIGQLQKNDRGELNDEQKKMLIEKLPEIDRQMGTLIDEAQKIRGEAREQNLRALEKNADSLGQTLQSARQKLGQFVALISERRPDGAPLQ